MVRKSRISRSRSQVSVPPETPEAAAEKGPETLHVEVAVALVLWGVAFPLLVLLTREWLLTVLATLLFAVVAALVVHAISLRPFCVERLDSQLQEEDLPPDQDRVAKEDCEEVKLMLTTIVLLCGVGCILCLALGGYAAFHSSFAAGTSGCSVTELAELQQAGYAKFFCEDGFVDREQEASILTKGSGFRGSMRVYRIAPIYESRAGGLPVAWSVTRDAALSDAPCALSPGLCGLFLPSLSQACMTSLVCFNTEERHRFAKLQGVISQALQASGAMDFHAENLPFVILTDPSDPLGNLRHLLWAAGFWIVTLLGLLLLLVDILVNDICARKPPASSYDPLLPYHTVKLEDETPPGSRKGSHISSEGKADLSVTFAAKDD